MWTSDCAHLHQAMPSPFGLDLAFRQRCLEFLPALLALPIAFGVSLCPLLLLEWLLAGILASTLVLESSYGFFQLLVYLLAHLFG